MRQDEQQVSRFLLYRATKSQSPFNAKKTAEAVSFAIFSIINNL